MMNTPQRAALCLGTLAFCLLLIFRPYDVCGRMMCNVVYAYFARPPATDPNEGGGLDEELHAAQLLLVVLATAAAVLMLESPFRLWRVIGLFAGLVIVTLFVAFFANSFPMGAFLTAMLGNGAAGITLAAVALWDRRREKSSRG